MSSDHELDRLRSALLTLSPAQQVAVEALSGGATQAVAAEAAGVTRETVTRWAGYLPAFRASLNLFRATIITEQIDAARRIRGKALTAVEKALDKGEIDPLAVLRALGDATSSVGPTVPEALLDSECNATRISLPPQPIWQDLEGLLESVTSPSSDVARADALTITRLAAAAGVRPSKSAGATSKQPD